MSTRVTVTKAGGSVFTELRYTTVITRVNGNGNTQTSTISTRTLGLGGGAVNSVPNPNSSGPAGGSGRPPPASSSTSTNGGSTVTPPSSSSSGAVPITPEQNNSGGSSISGGEVAGVAIGCLIAGALIAFLVAFLIFRKRNQRQASAGPYYQHNDSPTRGEVVALTEKPSSKSAGAVMGWQAFLPQSADDRTIQNGVKTFFNLIELHVDNFYRKGPVELDQHTLEALSIVDSGKLPGRIDQLMQDQRLVLPVIKHCIADLLIARMSPLWNHHTSLLPSNLSTIPPKLQAPSQTSNERNAATQAYSQWRLLNAYLYPHPEQDQSYIDDREAKANEISEQLSKAFAPWQGMEDDKGEMHTHEKGLVATAANLGILLMSQPSAFEFKWSADSGSRNSSGRSLIALPGFWKTTDEQGRPLGQPALLVSPLILRV